MTTPRKTSTKISRQPVNFILILQIKVSVYVCGLSRFPTKVEKQEYVRKFKVVECAVCMGAWVVKSVVARAAWSAQSSPDSLMENISTQEKLVKKKPN